MLYLVATPIGNLADISLRALEVLKTSDYILCEDTRHSGILFNHYQIKKPLKSYHKFNESFRAESVIEDLEAGKIICLVSDAGTPGISDPGEEIVKQCIERNISVTAIPGPCAAIQALICSGFCTTRFQFCGFLPKKENELKRELQQILSYQGTSICYESPHRLIDVLNVIQDMQSERLLCVGRELTKRFEEIVRGTPQFLLQYWNENLLKGEIVLLISPPPIDQIPDWEGWTPEEHVDWVQKTYNIDHKEAIKLVANLRGVPKRQIYKDLL